MTGAYRLWEGGPPRHIMVLPSPMISTRATTAMTIAMRMILFFSSSSILLSWKITTKGTARQFRQCDGHLLSFGLIWTTLDVFNKRYLRQHLLLLLLSPPPPIHLSATTMMSPNCFSTLPTIPTRQGIRASPRRMIFQRLITSYQQEFSTTTWKQTSHWALSSRTMMTPTILLVVVVIVLPWPVRPATMLARSSRLPRRPGRGSRKDVKSSLP
mmetsp:Transcript_15971/g.34723  ORF Transcript_15971/g.34723 Transcript_15971/m.34723 type:complete len:213 (+) Transcript_15971:286-924(+)